MLDPAEYAAAGERIIESAKESRIWGRLGPSVTKVAFQRKPEVSLSLRGVGLIWWVGGGDCALVFYAGRTVKPNHAGCMLVSV